MAQEEVESVRELYTDPVLRPLSVLLLLFVILYTALSIGYAGAPKWFVLLTAVVGPWAVVSGVYFDGNISNEPLQRFQMAFFISLLTGFYALLLGVIVWIDILTLGSTDTARVASGFGTGIPIFVVLYVWSYRRLEQGR